MFKFIHIYRQLSQYSLRLLSKKIVNTAGNSLSISSLTSSPRKASKRGLLNLRGSLTPFGIASAIQNQQVGGFSKLLPKRNYSDSITCTENEFVTNNPENCINKTQYSTPSETGNDSLFPLLTGEELKAFDSSVYE